MANSARSNRLGNTGRFNHPTRGASALETGPDEGPTGGDLGPMHLYVHISYIYAYISIYINIYIYTHFLRTLMSMYIRRAS